MILFSRMANLAHVIQPNALQYNYSLGQFFEDLNFTNQKICGI